MRVAAATSKLLTKSLIFQWFYSVTPRENESGCSHKQIIDKIIGFKLSNWWRQTPIMKFQLTCTLFYSLLEPL